MHRTPFQLAQKFLGYKEVTGATANPQILAMLCLDESWVRDDATPWCSAFVNYVCWLLDVPRSRSLAARSWLTVGQSVQLIDAVPGYDVVVLKRGKGVQPGPEVLSAAGHVGFYAGRTDTDVQVLGGNQGDAVTIASFPKPQLLGVRRLLSF